MQDKDGAQKSVVKMEFLLDKPIEHSLFRYLTDADLSHALTQSSDLWALIPNPIDHYAKTVLIALNHQLTHNLAFAYNCVTAHLTSGS